MKTASLVLMLIGSCLFVFFSILFALKVSESHFRHAAMLKGTFMDYGGTCWVLLVRGQDYVQDETYRIVGARRCDRYPRELFESTP